MNKKKQIYKCEICGQIIEILDAGAGTLVCCDEEMVLIDENNIEASVEKHIPIIEKVENGILVKVGSEEHPMTADHYIEWIEVEFENNTYRKYLNFTDKAEVFFPINDTNVKARAYCNLHKLWANK